MSAVVEKICEPNGRIVYRLTIKLPNGTTKIENFDRAFDAQKRMKEIDALGTKRNVIGSHYQ